jgi:hypothetical protein
MAWFSLWLPLVSQLVVPVLLLAWLARTPHALNARFIAVAALVATYILAIGIAGLWLVLPWYAPAIYGAAWLAVIARSRRRLTSAPAWPRARVEQAVTTIAVAGSIALLGLVAVAWNARRTPADAVEVPMPVRDGTYLVVNGGRHVLVNAHLNTLSGERFAPYRGQSYGVDLVRINRAGLRASGLLPADPAAYVIYGDPVLAPCAGRVVFAEDGAADMAPPHADRVHMAGNHVILECGAVWIVLGHLQRGSVAVRAGQFTEPGHQLGLVGNSGNSGEPHLHVHAQRPGSTLAPLSGEPVPIRLGGRYLVRNDRVRTNRKGPS